MNVPGTPNNDLLYGTPDADTITGEGGDDKLFAFGGDDTLDGGDGSDLLDGGEGADTMTGGTGNDYYYVDNLGDIVSESLGGGSDLVFTSISYILPDNVERLAVIDPATTSALSLLGNDLDNEIIGNNGANIIDGGAGADIMRGNGGDDQYVVSLQGNVTIGASPSGSALTIPGYSYLYTDAPDVIGENANGGTDTIFVPFTGSTDAHNWIDYTLIHGGSFNEGNVENLAVYDRTSSYAVNLQGDALNNQITGNQGANVLDGFIGADTMTGYGGDDVYFVDNRNDVVIEQNGQGYDTVFLTFYPGQSPGAGTFPNVYSMPGNVERLVALEGATYAGNLVGNGLDNEIIGNSLANTIDGAFGADVLKGGGGDDQYQIDQFDIVVEQPGEGIDTVILQFFSNYTLTDNVENLRGRGILTGNALNNVINGNDSTHDIIDGGLGADTMIGGGDDDIYFVDNVGDVVTELAGGGTDTIFATFDYTLGANVERLGAADMTGTAALKFTGNGLDNEIWGNDGANVIDGKGGMDILHGLGGADTFAFTSSLFGAGADQIADFEVGVDKIALDDAIFTALKPGALDPGAFTVGTAAQDADDRIIYDPATGWLYYDRDGSGASGVPIHFATVHEGMNVTASDFVVI